MARICQAHHCEVLVVALMPDRIVIQGNTDRCIIRSSRTLSQVDLSHALRCDRHHLFTQQVAIVMRWQISAVNGAVHESVVGKCAHFIV